jgi:hypothetical protein
MKAERQVFRPIADAALWINAHWCSSTGQGEGVWHPALSGTFRAIGSVRRQLALCLRLFGNLLLP